MARPPSTPPPVLPSTLTPASRRTDLVKYEQVAAAFERQDRIDGLRAMLGSDEAVQRFLQVALHAIATDSNLLLKATPESIIQAVRDSATLGLEPTGLTGDAWIVVYGDKAKLMPGWRGYLKRIRNSHKVQDVDTQVVYVNDEFRYGFTENGGWYVHNPAMPVKQENGSYLNDRGAYWGAYACAVMPSGYKELEVLPEVEINFIRDHYSQAARKPDSPWAMRWPEMARKTVLRILSKRLPQEAVEQLLLLDAEIDQAEREEAEKKPGFSATTAREAALAAMHHEVAQVSTTEEEDAAEAVTDAPDEVNEEAEGSDLSDLPSSWQPDA